MSSGNMLFVPNSIPKEIIDFALVCLLNPDKSIDFDSFDIGNHFNFPYSALEKREYYLKTNDNSFFKMEASFFQEPYNLFEKDDYFFLYENKISDYFDKNIRFYKNRQFEELNSMNKQQDWKNMFTNTINKNIKIVFNTMSEPICCFVSEEMVKMFGGFYMGIDNNHEISAIQCSPIIDLRKDKEEIINNLRTYISEESFQNKEWKRYEKIARYEYFGHNNISLENILLRNNIKTKNKHKKNAL